MRKRPGSVLVDTRKMIDDVRELVSLGRKIREAIEGADAVKTKIRAQLKDYDGMLQVLLQAELPDIEEELLKMRRVLGGVEELSVQHTAGPGDPRWVKFSKRVNRGTLHKTIEEDLDAFDAEFRLLFDVIATRSSIDTRKMIKQILRDLESQGKRTDASIPWAIAGPSLVGVFLVVLAAIMLSHHAAKSPIDIGELVELVLHNVELEGIRVADATQLAIVGAFVVVLVVFFSAVMMRAQRREVSTMIRRVLPPTLPELAAVPTGALALPRSFVKRSGYEEVVEDVISPEQALTPFTVVGMGGGGKSVLASAIVRDVRVRQHFRGGVFWVRVGREASETPVPLLDVLAREMGRAASDVPPVAPHNFDSLEQVKQHLDIITASAGSAPRLVVLDDVWKPDVVDALLPLQVKVLVTTRDRSVVGVPGRHLALGDMLEGEAMELLLKASSSVGQPGGDTRTQMTKVIDSSLNRGFACNRCSVLLHFWWHTHNVFSHAGLPTEGF